MNERSTYEQTIAGKLIDLPLPDMMDAIWARVEKQLDIDMPTDDGGIEPTTAPMGGWPGVGVVGMVLTAIAFIFIQQQHHQTNEIMPKSIITPQATLRPGPDSVIASKLNLETRPPAVAAGDRLDTGSVAYSPPEPLPDTATYVDPPTQADTQQVTATWLPPPSTDSAVNKPKARGVKGIADVDYRIEPARKDSSKKSKS